MTKKRKCDVCKKGERNNRIGIDDGQGDVGDEMRGCDSCLVAGVAEGFLDLNPASVEAEANAKADDEGEDWKSGHPHGET